MAHDRDAGVHERARRANETYLQGEVSFLRPKVPPPRSGRAYHLFFSPHNAGAAELVDEVVGELKLKQLRCSSDAAALGRCEQMLVYLNVNSGSYPVAVVPTQPFDAAQRACRRAGYQVEQL